MNHPTALRYYLEKYPDALDDVVKHFEPNYKTVFDFWYYVDRLDREFIKSIRAPRWSYDLEDYAGQRVHRQFEVWNCARYFGPESEETKDDNSFVLGYATLIDRLTFIPLFV
jgi:hypothetical protein